MSTLSPAGAATSTSLLRAILRPTATCTIQTRSASKVTLLDKLHRKQKAAVRQERLDSHIRAAKMTPLVQPSPTSPASPVTLSAPQVSSPYTIGRTRSRELAIYHLSKAGGNKHLTKLRKLEGDLQMLKDDVRAALDMPEFTIDMQGRKKESVSINWQTRQIILRGWRRPELVRWAEQKGF